jgi:hypothetical protein
MPRNYRKERGRETEHITAQYLTQNGFPHAQPTGAGRPGTDITGTPGIVWEIKARRALNLGADLRQVARHGDGLGILVIRLDGMGPASIADWPMVVRLSDGIPLLRAAGYGDQPSPLTLADWVDATHLTAAEELQNLTTELEETP